jgi:hypothetical protein
MGNRLLAAAIVASGGQAKARDWGVQMGDQLALKELDLAADRLESIAGKMTDEIETSVHFSMLPQSLKEAEVRTSVADPRVVADIVKLPTMNQVVVQPAPDPPVQ